MSKKERPEALAQFAESARRGERAGVAGLTATDATAPIPTESKAKDEAATRVLAEGATGEDLSADEYVDRLPDRILDSQQASAAGRQAAPRPQSPNRPEDADDDGSGGGQMSTRTGSQPGSKGDAAD